MGLLRAGDFGDGEPPKPLLHKVLRIGEVANGSTAAAFTAAQWTQMAAHLAMPEEQMLFQVVKGLVASLADAAIEHALDISHGTMRRYMDRLFEKFGTRSRTEIAMKAVEAMNREGNA